MPANEKTTGTIDRDWFMDQLAKKDRSVRGLARHLDVDASAVSRMLSGQRKMKMAEANLIASFLGVSVEEVLRHAGVVMDRKPVTTEIVLTAVINERGELGRIQEPLSLPQTVVDRALKVAPRMEEEGQIAVAQVRASEGPLSMWDDAVVLFSETDGVDQRAILGLFICRIQFGMQVLARVERARKTGEATLRLPSGELRDIIIEAAWPVLAIIP